MDEYVSKMKAEVAAQREALEGSSARYAELGQAEAHEHVNPLKERDALLHEMVGDFAEKGKRFDVVLLANPVDHRSLVKAIGFLMPHLTSEELQRVLEKPLPNRLLKGVTESQADDARDVLTSADAKVDVYLAV
ncbi:MAG: hypothetical protein NT154_38330 [Verrucomicrobia bacterium]|nr:hypothetical protein [Verrucomicrobiota bacterium]